jgi:hypothetical protein
MLMYAEEIIDNKKMAKAVSIETEDDKKNYYLILSTEYDKFLTALDDFINNYAKEAEADTIIVYCCNANVRPSSV